jgi:hypothetical protein
MVVLKQPTPLMSFVSLRQVPKSDFIHLKDENNWYETENMLPSCHYSSG